MKVRNVAIIAHVDHGKTTLVDQMLRQAGVFRENQEVRERVLDSNPLERERGITILSKNTSVRWGEFKINIVDTPGHADFGGEVERILHMVDGVLILVDAAEGPMPQTRFVTAKALELGHAPVGWSSTRPSDRTRAPKRCTTRCWSCSWISRPPTNSSTRPSCMPPAGRDGRRRAPASGVPTSRRCSRPSWITCPRPPRNRRGRSRCSCRRWTTLPMWDASRSAASSAGASGPARRWPCCPWARRAWSRRTTWPARRALKVYGFDGLERVDIAEAGAGDIVAVAGVSGVEIGRTLADPARLERLKGIAVERPTISVDFLVNDSPFSGEGKYVTTRQLRERLFREMERNVALKVEATEHPDTFRVAGRGELHLSILMETMRREGYEFQVSPPARAHARRSRRRASGALRGAGGGGARIPGGHGNREAGRATGQDAGDETDGPGTDPAALPDSGARPVRLPDRVSHRHPAGTG